MGNLLARNLLLGVKVWVSISWVILFLFGVIENEIFLTLLLVFCRPRSTVGIIRRQPSILWNVLKVLKVSGLGLGFGNTGCSSANPASSIFLFFCGILVIIWLLLHLKGVVWVGLGLAMVGLGLALLRLGLWVGLLLAANPWVGGVGGDGGRCGKVGLVSTSRPGCWVGGSSLSSVWGGFGELRVPKFCNVRLISLGVNPTGLVTNLATAGSIAPGCIICRLLTCSARW